MAAGQAHPDPPVCIGLLLTGQRRSSCYMQAGVAHLLEYWHVLSLLDTKAMYMDDASVLQQRCT